jgi:hypothetical protein
MAMVGMTEAADHASCAASLVRRSLDEHRRAALAVISQEAFGRDAEHAVHWMHSQTAEQVAQALASDQVDQLFLHATRAGGLASRFPPRVLDLLTTRRLVVAAEAIRQEHMLGDARDLLDKGDAAHVVLKGALVRQLLYAKPYLRPSGDVDLLIAPASAPGAIRHLQGQGFVATLATHSDTHEIWLERHGVGIDLHWSLLRPGRMRVNITPEILANRVRRGELWSPNDTHLTVAMLVHPAITDHVTGRLISAVDLDRWLRQTAVEWNAVIEVLGRIGLRTAAWAMLRWTHGLFDTPVPEEVWRALAPPRLRQRYIDAWLHRDPGRLYARRPNLVRGAFSLALQDRVSDAARALWKLARKDRISLAQT